MSDSFSFPRLFFDDYSVAPRVIGAGFYVKDMTFNGRSVLFEPLRFGAAKLARTRGDLQKVELVPNGSAQVTREMGQM